MEQLIYFILGLIFLTFVFVGIWQLIVYNQKKYIKNRKFLLMGNDGDELCKDVADISPIYSYCNFNWIVEE